MNTQDDGIVIVDAKVRVHSLQSQIEFMTKERNRLAGTMKLDRDGNPLTDGDAELAGLVASYTRWLGYTKSTLERLDLLRLFSFPT